MTTLAPASLPGSPGAPPLLLYDGECGLCDGLVQAVALRDGGRFRFAALQELGARHGVVPDAAGRFHSVTVVDGGEVLQKMAAVARVLRHLPSPYRWFAPALGALPAPIGDVLYDAVATRRHRIWPQTACWWPPPEHRARFVTA